MLERERERERSLLTIKRRRRKEGYGSSGGLRTCAAREVCDSRTRAFSQCVPNSVASVGDVRRAMADAAEVNMIE